MTAIYRRNCEELALLGFHSNGFYRVDLDGTGPAKSIRVYCDFNNSLQEKAASTVLRHNLQEETVNV